MISKRVPLILALACLTGCGEDVDKNFPRPREPSTYGIRDLVLTVNVSQHSIHTGDTLRIHMSALNPKDGSVDAWFTNSCQAMFWVYDDEGQDLTPPVYCLAMPTRLHMDAGARREYDFEWHTPCNLRSGTYQVLAGFRAAFPDTPYTADPIAVEFTEHPVDVTGTWVGVAYGFSDIPEQPDSGITLTLTQDNSTVSGKFEEGDIELSIHSGTFQDCQLVFTIRSERNDLEIEFTGELQGKRVDGIRVYKRLSTGEVLTSNLWYVERAG